MVFAPTNNPNDTSDQTVSNITFFPAIAVAAFRAATRAQDTVTDQRVIQALRTAIIDVNRELAEWRGAQLLLGYATLAEVPADNYGTEQEPLSELTHWDLTAVYSMAKAQLIEVYNDIDTTEEGMRRFIGFNGTEDGYRREAREAIRNILREPHLTVELI
jgi:hypothetical protein